MKAPAALSAPRRPLGWLHLSIGLLLLSLPASQNKSATVSAAVVIVKSRKTVSHSLPIIILTVQNKRVVLRFRYKQIKLSFIERYIHIYSHYTVIIFSY